MLRYVATRFLTAIPTLLAVVLTLFLIVHLAPGDPVQAIVGNISISPEFKAQVVEKYNLDASLPERYVSYVWSLLQGDLGQSTAFGNRDVASLIWSRLPPTALLVGVSLVIASVVGTLLGIIAARGRGGRLDGAISVSVLVAFATPGFWLGQLLVMFFALRLGWLPTGGMSSVGSQASGLAGALEVARHLILPVLALCALEVAAVARVSRASAAEVYDQDYIATARLKHVPRSRILRSHVLRNSLLPVLTVVGYRAGTALAGTVLIETVFSWPGMGLLLVEAIGSRDNQVIVGIVLMLAVMAIVVNLLTDLAYGMLDPRVRR